MNLNDTHANLIIKWIRRSALFELDLSWNDFTYLGSTIIIKALKGAGVPVRYFSYSWNSLTGHNLPEMIATYIKRSTSLMHLNISNCSLTDYDLY